VCVFVRERKCNFPSREKTIELIRSGSLLNIKATRRRRLNYTQMQWSTSALLCNSKLILLAPTIQNSLSSFVPAPRQLRQNKPFYLAFDSERFFRHQYVFKSSFKSFCRFSTVSYWKVFFKKLYKLNEINITFSSDLRKYQSKKS